MKKFTKVLFLAVALAALLAVAACTNNNDDTPTTPRQESATPPAQTTPVEAAAPGEDADVEVDAGDPRLAAHGLDENLRFLETVHITAALWDRGNERVPDFSQSYWAEWIQEQILIDHNIAVEFVAIPRWEEQPFLTTLLGAGDAPDVSFTFSFPLVETFANMGAVTDLAPLLAQYSDWMPNTYGLLTTENVYWHENPQTGNIWALAGRHITDGRINTFIREDWLNTLGIAPPTTQQEFEDALIAFRDNAELLLGADASRLVPFMMGSDVGWETGTLIESFIPDNISERDWFVYGFDDRRFMHPTTKEAIRVVNRWFNEGLIFQEFAYGEAGTLGADMIRLGHVGAFIANWDLPFRAADRYITEMREHIGPEANFIVVTPFPNDAGHTVMYMPPPTDRQIFIPHSASNPVAALLYIDWMSRASVREYLAFGVEGIHRETQPDGAILSLAEGPADEAGSHRFPDNMVIPSLRNFDISLMVNGVDLGDPARSLATLMLSYPGIAPEAIMAARDAGLNNQRVFRQVSVRPIDAQEGMSTPLNEFRDTVLHNSVVAPVAEFDAVWDRMYAQYLAMGGQAIINERRQAWEETFGDVDYMPGWQGW